jgi:hypothetical protein
MESNFQLTEAEKLARGNVRFYVNYEAEIFIHKAIKNGRAKISPEDELRLWRYFENLCKELSPKCKFNKNGVCNNEEKRRRNAMFGIIRIVNLRSKDTKIEEIFKRNFGQISLQWMMACCGTDAPVFYYEWAFDAIADINGKTWGPKALGYIKISSPHMELFKKLEKDKFDLLMVKKVMQC